jgi:hypothetical protein
MEELLTRRFLCGPCRIEGSRRLVLPRTSCIGNGREQEAFGDEEEINQRSVSCNGIGPNKRHCTIASHCGSCALHIRRTETDWTSSLYISSPHSAAVTESLQKGSQQTARHSMSPVPQLIRRNKETCKEMLTGIYTHIRQFYSRWGTSTRIYWWQRQWRWISVLPWTFVKWY